MREGASDRANSAWELGHTNAVGTVSTSEVDPVWDWFVLRHPDPHHEQLCGWSVARRTVGWQPVRVVLTLGGQVVGGAQIQERTIARGMRIGYLNRGPMSANGDHWDRLIAEISQVARRRRWLYLAVSLPYQAADAVPRLERAGYLRRPRQLPPAVWARATTTIDLTESEEKIFARFQSTLRNRIRSGVKAGLIFSEGGRADLATFWTLMVALCQRRKVQPNVPSLAFLQTLWDELTPLKAIRLLFVSYRGEVVGARILVTLGAVARDWRVGSADRVRGVDPMKAFYWDTIRRAKQEGFKVFDFCGIDHEDASELLAGRPASAPFRCGISGFKCGFGGRIQLLPGEFCYFPNPLLRRLLGWGGPGVLENRLLSAVAARLHRRSTKGGGRV